MQPIAGSPATKRSGDEYREQPGSHCWDALARVLAASVSSRLSLQPTVAAESNAADAEQNDG